MKRSTPSEIGIRVDLKKKRGEEKREEEKEERKKGRKKGKKKVRNEW
jgi:hypothetical protein